MWGVLTWIGVGLLAWLLIWAWVGKRPGLFDDDWRVWLGRHIGAVFTLLLLGTILCFALWLDAADAVKQQACRDRGGEVIEVYRGWWCAAPGTTR